MRSALALSTVISHIMYARIAGEYICYYDFYRICMALIRNECDIAYYLPVWPPRGYDTRCISVGRDFVAQRRSNNLRIDQCMKVYNCTLYFEASSS